MPGKKGKRHIWGSKKSQGRKNSAQGRKRRSSGRTYEEAPGGSRPASSGYRGQESGILQKYLEPDRDREKELEARKKEIMAARQAKEERRRRAMKEAAASRVSYVRKPFAIRSRMSILLALAALSLGGAGIYQGVVTQGQAALVSGALGFCSIFLSVLALWYGGISFLEDDKNYILAKLGIALSILLLAGWTAVITIGLGG